MDASTQTNETNIDAILEELRNIRKDTHRNSLVAEKYGAKGDAIFDLVEKMATIISTPIRYLYGGAKSIENS